MVYADEEAPVKVCKVHKLAIDMGIRDTLLVLTMTRFVPEQVGVES